jgi:hypothetical protein
MLALLDSLMLPWAVDELEVQLLLAIQQTCVFRGFHCSRGNIQGILRG